MHPKTCPFCGRFPKMSTRAASMSEVAKREESDPGFIAFVACYGDGYSAHSHMSGRGATPEAAEQAAIEKWNKRAD